jgi:hypothetical protein
MARVIFLPIPADADISAIEALINSALAANPTYRFASFGAEWMTRCVVLQEV